MVTYEFKCPKCRKHYIVLQEMHAEHEYTCPRHGIPCRQVYSFNKGTIDIPNGFDDGINIGLGEHFDSCYHRDEFAKRHGMKKA
jgi:hypothetical protein